MIYYRTGDPEKDKILGRIGDMKYPDIKANCLIRGCPFEKVIDGDFPKLCAWLYKNWHTKEDPSKLLEFDAWMDTKLEERGYKKGSAIRNHKQFTAESPKEDPSKAPLGKEAKKEALPKKKKIKKERDANFGIYKGTKKEATYSLTETLYRQLGNKYDKKVLVKKFTPQLLDKLKKKFGDTPSEKSVKIWMKRCLDSIDDKAKGNKAG